MVSVLNLKPIISPKGNLLYSPDKDFKIFFNSKREIKVNIDTGDKKPSEIDKEKFFIITQDKLDLVKDDEDKKYLNVIFAAMKVYQLQKESEAIKKAKRAINDIIN